MKCPRCNCDLNIETYRNIEIDRCQQCQGMWLDYGELDQLEDLVLDKDEIKGTMVFRSITGEMPCPKCTNKMQRFLYRAYNLELDFCEQGHGTWLDAGEEKKVLDLMKQRITDLNRKNQAEAEWGNLITRIGSPSFFGKIKGLFRK